MPKWLVPHLGNPLFLVSASSVSWSTSFASVLRVSAHLHAGSIDPSLMALERTRPGCGGLQIPLAKVKRQVPDILKDAEVTRLFGRGRTNVTRPPAN
jgi:hypothetical protein